GAAAASTPLPTPRPFTPRASLSLWADTAERISPSKQVALGTSLNRIESGIIPKPSNASAAASFTKATSTSTPIPPSPNASLTRRFGVSAKRRNLTSFALGFAAHFVEQQINDFAAPNAFGLGLEVREDAMHQNRLRHRLQVLHAHKITAV